jgi:hypothetical protein
VVHPIASIILVIGLLTSETLASTLHRPRALLTLARVVLCVAVFHREVPMFEVSSTRSLLSLESRSLLECAALFAAVGALGSGAEAGDDLETIAEGKGFSNACCRSVRSSRTFT